MTTERDKAIAEAVIEAAAKLVDYGPHSAGEFCSSQIRTLDLDAIIASVPETMNDRYGDGSQHAICKRCGLCSSCGDCTCAPTEGKP